MSLARLMGKAAKGAAPVSFEMARESILKERDERIRGYQKTNIADQRTYNEGQIADAREHEQGLLDQQVARDRERNVITNDRAERILVLNEKQAGIQNDSAGQNLQLGQLEIDRLTSDAELRSGVLGAGTPEARIAAIEDILSVEGRVFSGAGDLTPQEQRIADLEEEKLGGQVSAQALKLETDSAEQASRDVSITNEAQRAYDLTTKMLGNMGGLEGATGPASSIIPSLNRKTLDFEANMEELENLLTLGNLGRMTGVLSETDIRILKNAASGLSLGGSEGRMKEKLQEINQRLSQGEGIRTGAPSSGGDISELSDDEVLNF